MNEAGLFEYRERVQELGRENLHKLSAEALELVLLDKLVEVRRQQLEDEAQVVFVDERVPETKDMVLVMWVALLVELGVHKGQ